MKIRKEFKFEMAHIVRNAWSERCAFSMHGHSYRVEVFLGGKRVDEGQMLVDFGIIKELINDFLDSFDHSTMLWNTEDDRHITEFFLKNFDRVILTPFSSTAERQAEYFFFVIDSIIKKWKRETRINGVDLVSVRVHETKTGRAEADKGLITCYKFGIIKEGMELKEFINNRDTFRVTEKIASEWKNPSWLENLY